MIRITIEVSVPEARRVLAILGGLDLTYLSEIGVIHSLHIEEEDA